MTPGSSQNTNKEAQDWEKQKRTHGWEPVHATSIHDPLSQVHDSIRALLPFLTSASSTVIVNLIVHHAVHNTLESRVPMTLKGSEDSPEVAVIHMGVSPGI